jgi:hypothetical protein
MLLARPSLARPGYRQRALVEHQRILAAVSATTAESRQAMLAQTRGVPASVSASGACEVTVGVGCAARPGQDRRAPTRHGCTNLTLTWPGAREDNRRSAAFA